MAVVGEFAREIAGQTQSASVQTKETLFQINRAATCAISWIILTIIGIGIVTYIAFVVVK